MQAKVASRDPGTCFGELALMYNAPRAATVVATSDAVLWAVDRYTIRSLPTATVSIVIDIRCADASLRMKEKIAFNNASNSSKVKRETFSRLSHPVLP